MTQIAVSFPTGRTLTLTARTPSGTLRGTANQSMTEAQTEHYVVNTDVNLQTGDIVKIKDSVWGVVLTGEYKPQMDTASLESEINNLAIEAGKQFTEEKRIEPDLKARIINI